MQPVVLRNVIEFWGPREYSQVDRQWSVNTVEMLTWYPGNYGKYLGDSQGTQKKALWTSWQHEKDLGMHRTTQEWSRETCHSEAVRVSGISVRLLRTPGINHDHKRSAKSNRSFPLSPWKLGRTWQRAWLLIDPDDYQEALWNTRTHQDYQWVSRTPGVTHILKGFVAQESHVT